MKKTTQQRYDDYMNTYNGRNLNHPLDTVGIWKVLGEDPNCDFGGHHYEPEIGYFEGKLQDVIMLCVDKRNFWSWGGGGRFILINVKNTTLSIEEMQSLKEEKERLEQRLAEINNIL